MVSGVAQVAHERPSNATVVRVVLITLGILLLASAAYRVRSVLFLVLVAAFLAIGMDPAVRRLERWKIKRGWAVTLILLAVVAFIAAFIAAVVPRLVEQITQFASDLPDYVEDIGERYPRIQDYIEKNDIPNQLRDVTQQLPSTISGSIGSVLGFAGSVVGALFSLITVLVLTIYFLLSLSHIREGSLKMVPKSRRERVKTLMDPILEKIGGYIAGQIVVALIGGVLAFVFLWAMGVPSPVALALWVTIAALIPLIGATIGAIPAVIVAFVNSTTTGIIVLLYFIVYQQIENYAIAPRVMTKAVDVSPAAILVAALIGGTLLGFVGALMAIPAAAAIRIIFQEVLLPRVETA
ncbi:MAG: AI-2E family transporter [Actinobacteria bacterium]|nr:AI-2E family transporter [Actinomycetota bacterium]